MKDLLTIVLAVCLLGLFLDPRGMGSAAKNAYTSIIEGWESPSIEQRITQ